MKLTNKLDLPQAVVDAIKNDGYDKGDADKSVTGLLEPPRISILKKQYADQIEEDVSDRVWSLLGQSIHTIMERANRSGIAERRLSMEVEGWKISGGMDLYEENGTLTDYKVTSVWKLIKGDLEEWTKQLNLYSVILRHHGHSVKRLQIVAILRDWSKREAENDVMYPQAQIVNVNIELWPADVAEKFMRERVILHKQAQLSTSECSASERWAKDNVWAVMKPGRKSAVKLCKTEDEARAFVGFDKNLTIVLRPGESTRCKSYCPVSKFCSQYQSSLSPADRPSADDTCEKEAV